MDDITAIVLHYRETVCQLWNTGFLPRYNEEHPSLFFGIEYRLFYALIVHPLGFLTFQTGVAGDFPFGRPADMIQEWDDGFGIDPIPYLYVIPQHKPTAVYWLTETDYGIVSTASQIDPTAIDLRLIYFYDYRNEFDPLNYRYYEARVMSYPPDPDKEGMNLLIKVDDAKVLFEPVAGAVWMVEPDPKANDG